MANSSQKPIVVLLGNDRNLKNKVWAKLLGLRHEVPQSLMWSDKFEKQESRNVVIVNTPNCPNVDVAQLIALSSPGPHAFLLVLAPSEKPLEELAKWEKETRQKNMYHYTAFVSERFRESGTHFSRDKYLQLHDSQFLEKCETFCELSQSHPYQYYNGDFSAATGQQHFSPNKPLSPNKPFNPTTFKVNQRMSICLLGETGSGKSASGNTILGSDVFPSKVSGAPVTKKCYSHAIPQTDIKVIDTPDFFDDGLDQPSKHILEFRQMSRKDCVYLLVLQIGRFTEGERGILDKLEKALQTRIRERTIILFTRGDDLDQHIDDYVRNTNIYLQQLIKKCGDRYHMFDNKGRGDCSRQVEELISKITRLLPYNL